MSTTRTFARCVASIALAAILLVVAWLNYVLLSEAYGLDAPYYGRTTNMDKWSDPLPVLLPLDVVTLVGAFVALRALHRSVRGSPPK